MSPIVPAIIPESREHLDLTLKRISPFTHEAQVDVVDGKFVPFTSWPYGEGALIKDIAQFTQEFLIEVDLMVSMPETVIEEYLKAGVRRVIVHLESTKELSRIHALKERYDFKLGFSIENDTHLEVLTDVIQMADYVQLMGIAKIGSQGQPFDVRVLQRIRDIKASYPNLLISIDGSVNEETVAPLMKAGADRCVVGSAIVKQEDSRHAFDILVHLAQESQIHNTL